MYKSAWLVGGTFLLGTLSALAWADRPRPTPANWILDYSRAKALARQSGKPLFITFHWERWTDCYQFNEQVVRPTDREFADLLNQFVCVRILQMNEVDVGQFQFDFDVTWMSFFLDSSGHILSRYGGRDANSPDARLSIEGLKYTMHEVLRIAKQERPAESHTPLIARDLGRTRGRGCMHCHQVWEGLRRREKEENRFDRESLFVYPPPDNLGLELDVKAGNKVTTVRAGSAAEKAGLRSGDLLKSIEKVKVYSQGDVFWALQNAPAEGKLALAYRRDGKEESATLELERGWRKTDLSWRPSMRREKAK